MKLGADKSFIKAEGTHLEKFLKKISVKKKNRKRGLSPFLWKMKYRNGAVMVFQYEDGRYGALIAVDSKFTTKHTILI